MNDVIFAFVSYSAVLFMLAVGLPSLAGMQIAMQVVGSSAERNTCMNFIN